MGAAEVKATASGRQGLASETPVRPAAHLALSNRPGHHWLVANLSEGWAIWRDGQIAAASTESPEVLVRWGSLEGPEGGRLTLNPVVRLRVAQEPLEVQSVWQAARVRTLPAESAAQVRRRFRVDVFNGQVLAMHLRGRGGGLRPLAWGSSREGLLVAWHAMRALHALRLDFGAVWIGVQGLRTYALDVEPSPRLTPALAATYVAALEGLDSDLLWWPGDPPATQPDVVLGADPEFVLRDQASGEMIPASDYFSRYGVVGCDRQLFDRA
ncbi:MAG: hypothetical protein M1602_06425, partial [Firmicutes bacterium]|nr:hypothetical protein [Bacillota bacterium]